ncbi:hypothetical protein [Methyloraptor flagellatus]|uniref:DUF4760 domain-containing protein n=1 Tax=Methyloraptor flagellatus TaxID=3162530 RepID=A0AAU7X895_9HYPH
MSMSTVFTLALLGCFTPFVIMLIVAFAIERRIKPACARFCRYFYKFGSPSSAMVAAAIASFALLQDSAKIEAERKDDFVAFRNLACLATRFVIPFLKEVDNREPNLLTDDKIIVFDVAIKGLESIDLKRVYPPHYSDNFLDIYHQTLRAREIEKTIIRDKIIPNFNDLTNSISKTIQKDIDSINEYTKILGSRHLAKCI